MDLTAAAQAFQILGAHLKEAGEGGLRRELSDKIRDAMGPVQDEIRTGLPAHMPRPYASALDTDLKLSVSQQAGGTSAGVRLIASSRMKKRRLTHLNAGVLTHPLFGDRSRWFSQADGVTRGFFTDPAQRSAPQMREAILAAMRDVADRVTRKV